MHMGVTYEQVAAIADQQSADGKTPSALTAHTALGHGSLSTLQKHIDKWRRQRTGDEHDASATNLPPALRQELEAWCRQTASGVRLELDGLVEVARHERDDAQQCLEATTNAFAEVRHELSAMRSQVADNATRIIALQDQLQAATVAATATQQALTRAESALAVADEKVATARRDAESAMKQAAEAKLGEANAQERAYQAAKLTAEAEAATLLARAAKQVAEERAHEALHRERAAEQRAVIAENAVAEAKARADVNAHTKRVRNLPEAKLRSQRDRAGEMNK
jgi:colicin import membrane protein